MHAGSEQALDTMHQATTGYFITGTSSIDVTTTTQTERDDQLFVQSQTFDVWRVPAMGLQSVNDQGTVLPPDQQPVNPTFEASFPGTPINVSTAGRTTDAYQPPHINGNLLSYPSYTGSGGSWEPDDIGAFVEWRDTNNDGIPDSPSASQPPAGIPLWNSQSFVIGGSSTHNTYTYTATGGLTTHMGNSDTYAESAEFTAGGEVSAEYGVASAEATIDYTYSSKDTDTIAHATNSQNFSSIETAFGLYLVSGISSSQNYGFRPAWYFTPGGAMKVAHGVNTAQGNGETFWNSTYGPPDPALDLPFRFEFVGGTWTLNTDSSTRARMKGFFIQDQSFNDYFIPPYAGDQVVLTARVYNLSKNTDATSVRVRFELQEVVTDSMGVHEIGPRFMAGDYVVPTIPKHGGAELPNREPGAPNNSVLASVVWDTTQFGPPPGQVLRDWRVYVILDPSDAIANEKHELLDRYNDALGATPIGPLEKGQNNTGWAPVSIGAKLDETLALTIGETPDVFVPAGGIELIDPTSGRGKADFAEARKGDELKLRVRIQATGVKPRVGTLTVLAKGPDGVERAVVMRRVWGVDPQKDRLEFIDWTPEEAGHYTLTAHYSEPANDRRTGNSDGTLEVRVTAP